MRDLLTPRIRTTYRLAKRRRKAGARCAWLWGWLERVSGGRWAAPSYVFETRDGGEGEPTVVRRWSESGELLASATIPAGQIARGFRGVDDGGTPVEFDFFGNWIDPPDEGGDERSDR